MADGIKIGNYKPSQTEYKDLEATGVSTDPETGELVVSTQVVDPTPPQGDLQVDPPATPQADIIPQGSPAALEPTTDPVDPSAPVVDPEPQQVHEPAVIQDSDILTALSERLGREVKTFDELNTPQVVNALDDYPQLKEIMEWSERTGRPIEDWMKFQKDYKGMDDLSVVRESLQQEFPDLTSEEIELELQKYIVTDEDLPTEAATKKLELKKAASRGRASLDQNRLVFNTPASMQLPKEVQEKVTFAEKMKAQMEANQNAGKAYWDSVAAASSDLAEIPLELDKDLTINFSIAPEVRKLLPQLVQAPPHWYNEDGSIKAAAVVRDAAVIRSLPEMIKAAYAQGVSAGELKATKQENNVSFERNTATGEVDTKKFEVEGLDTMLGKNGPRFKFGLGRK